MIRLFDGTRWVSYGQTNSRHNLSKTWRRRTLSPDLRTQFEAAQRHEQRQRPTIVDTELLAGTTVNFPRSLVRLAWILQHAATLLPMAGDIQAVPNSHTAGVSDIHAWGLMLPSSSRVAR